MLHFTSAVQKWKGTMESLKANPTNNITKANTCNGAPVNCNVISENDKDPVVPYINEMPINKKAELNADDIIIFIPASEEALLLRLKLAKAANGIVDSSKPM